MKVLYVVGTNLSKNTSANISHNAFVQGLLENNCNVDILMASSSWGQHDLSLEEWKEATYYTYNSVPLITRLKDKFKNIFDKKVSKKADFSGKSILLAVLPTYNPTWKSFIRKGIKKIYQSFFPSTRLYILERRWLHNASNFKKKNIYDLILSNSSPAASHKLALILLSKKNIKGKRWVQIWEDPWFYDLYGGYSEYVKQEEHRLLRAAHEVFYVSPLTLAYQKLHFPDCAYKMKHIPLPYLRLNEPKQFTNSDRCTFGYFGDYYSKTRNLRPFYEAIQDSKAPAYIYGDSDLSLPSTDLIKIEGRVTIDKLTKIQNECSVLVHLCNLSGGQIPGKIYHYSATTKPILFILDGTAEEIDVIKNYFKKYDRYHFCENKKEDISRLIQRFLNGEEGFQKQAVPDFSPKVIISQLLTDKI